MYERFTDRARKVLHLADLRAKAIGHEYVGTDDVLIGLMDTGSVAFHVLRVLKVDFAKLHSEVERMREPGNPEAVTIEVRHRLPLTARLRRVIDLANAEGEQRNSYVGTEHLLLAIVLEGETVAAHALWALGVTAEAIRSVVPETLAARPESDTPAIVEARP